MIELTRKDIALLLEWWSEVQIAKQDTLSDHDLAARLRGAANAMYEQERAG